MSITLKREPLHNPFNLNATEVLVLFKYLELFWNLEQLHTINNILQLWIPQVNMPFKN